MITKKYVLLFLSAFFIALVFIHSESIAQETENIEEQVLSEEGNLDKFDIMEASSIWDLLGQAGGIRFPIYAILIAGIFLISLRSFELFSDSRKQKHLHEISFQDLSLNQIDSEISVQQDFMLSRIMAKLLNVFLTKRNADYLHDEISNYNSIQQDNFNIFKNRIDFLSDTAGALGLLGTVWGMFMVFSSGTLEREIILVGMGIALLSTFLGLVVSIILNFCTTLTEGYFSKHLETIAAKADELRFRLIELSESSESSQSADLKREILHKNTSRYSNSNSLNNPSPKKTENPLHKKATKEINKPAHIILQSSLETIKAGESYDKIDLQLMGALKVPIADTELEIIYDFNNKATDFEDTIVVKTDKNGYAAIRWEPKPEVGLKKALIRCKVDPEINLIIESQVAASNPENLLLLNNNQAGLIDQPLKYPICVVVKDKFENSVSSINVHFSVALGNGTFENGKNNYKTVTDNDGKASLNFTLGSEPGFNAVDISLPEFKLTKTFQAVAQEVNEKNPL